MDIQEKRVLRRKIPLLKRVMTENSQLLTACVSQGLIAKEQLKQLTCGGGVTTELVMTFLTILEQGVGRTNFDRLIYALRNAGLADAIDEIQVEMMAEKKQLSPPEVLTSETRLLTNKLFTGHRVLKPCDADELGALLAERYMVATEIGQRRLDRYRKSAVKGQSGLLESITDALDEVDNLIKTKFNEAPQDKEDEIIGGAIEETPGECSAHCSALSLLRKRISNLVGCIEEMAQKQDSLLDEQVKEEQIKEEQVKEEQVKEDWDNSEEDNEGNEDNAEESGEDEDDEDEDRDEGAEEEEDKRDVGDGMKNEHSGSRRLTKGERKEEEDESELWRRKVAEKEIVIAELLRTLHECRHVEETLRVSSHALGQHCRALDQIKSPQHKLQCKCILCERRLDYSNYECSCAICQMRRLVFDGSATDTA